MTLAAIWTLGFLLISAPSSEQSPAPGSTHFRLVPLASGVYAAIAKSGDRDSVGNAGFIVGEEAVCVVDSFASPAAAQELIEQIRRVTNLPVRWLVDTHYHLDHIGGNGVFQRAGALILAHENVRAWARTENLKFRPGQREMIESLALPQITYRQGLTIWLGARRVDVVFRPGHTGGDSVVRVPDVDVVFAGDLFWNSTVPNMIDADSAAWLKTVDGFLDEFPRASFVPGHGEPGHALNVRFFRDYLFGLRQGVSRGIEEGKSGQALLEFLLPLHGARFGAWTWFEQFAGKNIELTEEEMRGTKRYPPTPGP